MNENNGQFDSAHSKTGMAKGKSWLLLRPRAEERRLRRWQEKAVRRFFSLLSQQHMSLITATPGAGKSQVAGEIGRRMIESGKAARIVVVVPTEQLKMQWARVFVQLGIDLDPNWSNASCTEAEDYLGVIVTYQQVSAEPSIYNFNCEQKATFVIFDEIHHAADGLDWGDKLKIAFFQAKYVLSLSGTPFRHDNNSIPFVRYSKHNKSVADFSYSYGEALADGVCRPVFFPSFEGSAKWYDSAGNLKSQSQFAGISNDRAAELLRALLNPDGDWMRTILREADDRLTEFRLTSHADAGGLVIAMDQHHARRIGKALKKISGEEPVIVISDEADSARYLYDFARPGAHQRWIVAVKMVSEGIDIPRLRVGVYATNILSELFFRQAVGRFVRVIAGLDEQSAAFYLPAHPKLIRHALAIKEEREHTLPFLSYKNRLAANGENKHSGSVLSGGGINGDDAVNVNINGLLGEKADGDDDLNSPTNFCPENIFGEANVGESQPWGTQSSLPPASAEHLSSLPNSISRQVLVTVTSEARYHETIFDGMRFSDNELRQAEVWGKRTQINAPPERLAALIRHLESNKKDENGSGGKNRYDDSNSGNLANHNLRNSVSNAAERNSAVTLSSRTLAPDDRAGNYQMSRHSNIPASATAQTSTGQPVAAQTLSERKKELRNTINMLANRLAYRRRVGPEIIHGEWKYEIGKKSNEEATEEQLRQKLDWVVEQLAQTNRQEGVR